MFITALVCQALRLKCRDAVIVVPPIVVPPPRTEEVEVETGDHCLLTSNTGFF